MTQNVFEQIKNAETSAQQLTAETDKKIAQLKQISDAKVKAQLIDNQRQLTDFETKQTQRYQVALAQYIKNQQAEKKADNELIKRAFNQNRTKTIMRIMEEVNQQYGHR